MKKILIIGSNSFSAGSFIDLLLKKKYFVIGISRSKLNSKKFLRFDNNNQNFIFFKLDINKNQKSIISIIKKYKPAYVVNYASQSMVGESWKDAQDWFFTNSYSMPMLYKRIYDLNIISKLIHISTPEVYGSTNKKIIESNNFNPSTPYAVSRVTTDLYLKILNEFKSFPFSSVRAANVYGEFQKLYRIIPKAVGYFLNNKKIHLDGGGLSKRSFIHIDDVSRATYLILDKGRNGETYHVSNENLISIKSLVKIIALKTNTNFNDGVIISPDRIGKDAFYNLDSSKIQKLGWNSIINLEDGIDRVISWYRKYSHKVISSDYNYKHKK